MKTLKHPRAVIAVAFSPDGRWLATGGIDDTLRIWDIDKSEVIQSVKERPCDDNYEGLIRSICFHPNGRVVSYINPNSELCLLDTVCQDKIDWPPQGWIVSEIRFSPDRRHIAVGEYTNIVSVLSLSASRKEPLCSASVDSYAISLAFSPDGRLLAIGTCESKVYVADTLTGTVLQRFEGFEPQLEMVRFSSDGRVLVMAANAILQVRDTTHWGLVSSRSVFPAPLYSIGICPTDNRVAAGFADGTIEIWAADLTTLRRLPGHKDLVYSLDWSFDGLLLASGGDSTAKIWIIQG